MHDLFSHATISVYRMPYFSDKSLRCTALSGLWEIHGARLPFRIFLLVQKFGIPEQISRFDIITIRSEALDNRIILKRVIGFVPSALQYASKNNSTYYIHNPALFQPYVQNRQKKQAVFTVL